MIAKPIKLDITPFFKNLKQSMCYKQTMNIKNLTIKSIRWEKLISSQSYQYQTFYLVQVALDREYCYHLTLL